MMRITGEPFCALFAQSTPVDSALPISEWPYLQAIQRLALAVALGIFVGLERQRRGKEAGVRTFAFAGMIGCLGGLLGESFALVS